MTDLLHFTKLIELLLYGAACVYIGHQTAKPKEQRHWRKIRNKLAGKPPDDTPKLPLE